MEKSENVLPYSYATTMGFQFHDTDIWTYNLDSEIYKLGTLDP